MASFGENLKKWRKERRRTQEEVARVLGVSNTYIHQLETGKIEAPTERRCEQLASVLEVPFDDLWGRAQRERLERFARRQGMDLGAEQSDLLPLTRPEELLVNLYRRLDDSTRKDFNGLIVMLLRHYPEDEVREKLREFLDAA